MQHVAWGFWWSLLCKGSGKGDENVILVWTQLKFLPLPEGVSKGPGRVETS